MLFVAKTVISFPERYLRIWDTLYRDILVATQIEEKKNV
jgi:hypothetical protein